MLSFYFYNHFNNPITAELRSKEYLVLGLFGVRKLAAPFWPPLCMAFSWSYVRHLVHLPLYGVFCFGVFFIFESFSFLRLFCHPFFQLFYRATRTDPDGLSSCASRSDSQISLSYSMAVFNTNSFGLYFISIAILTFKQMLTFSIA